MGKQQDVGEPDRHSGSGATAHRLIGGGADERLTLAQDPTTPQMTLIDLASDPSAVVRKAVAARADAPAQALRPLTRDQDRQVREAVARNPSTSIANLMRLVKDADRWVRWAVASNPACDESIRRVMSEASDKELRGLLAESRELEPELAAKLTDDVSPEVRERLATHTHDPDAITALLADRTARVRKGLPATRGPPPNSAARSPRTRWSTSAPRWSARSSWTRLTWSAWSTTVRCRSDWRWRHPSSFRRTSGRHSLATLTRWWPLLPGTTGRDLAVPPPCGLPGSRTGPPLLARVDRAAAPRSKAAPRRHHQGIGPLRSKLPPVGPSGPTFAIWTMISTSESGVIHSASWISGCLRWSDTATSRKRSRSWRSYRILTP